MRPQTEGSDRYMEAPLRLPLLLLLLRLLPALCGSSHDAVTRQVRAMYEEYPFPSHDPDQIVAKGRVWERGGGYIGPSHVPDISHHLFGGRLEQRFRASGETLRVLVAGGGTGMTTLALAQQLGAVGALRWSIVHLDLTPASIAIAERRMAANGLSDRVTFVRASLFDVTLAQLGGEPFDYIDCAGVLHHTPDPSAGLANLAKLLHNTPSRVGGMGLMLYGELGRAGIYEFREQLRLLAGDDVPTDAKIALARRLLESTPSSHPLARNANGGFDSYSAMDDQELVDTLLHVHDVPFKVPGLYELAATAGLEITSWASWMQYEPCAYLGRPDPELCQETLKLPTAERFAFGELLAGNVQSHEFYLAPPGTQAVRFWPPEAEAEAEAAFATPLNGFLQSLALDAIPIVRNQQVWEGQRRAVEAQASDGVPAGKTALSMDYIGAKMAWPLRSAALSVKLMASVQGNEQAGARRTMAELCVEAGSAAESAECSTAWIELHHVFQGMGWLVYSYDDVGWTGYTSVAAKNNQASSSSDSGGQGVAAGSGRKGKRRKKNRPA
jgi:SAM-dependent methyltransferase